MRFFISVALLGVCLVLPLHAESLLKAGNTTATVSPTNNWTLSELSWFKGDLISAASAQGTVVEEGGVWVGSAHGGEATVSATLLVDGTPAALQDNQTYSGSNLALTRNTTLGETFQLTSTMQITETKLTETVSLTRTASTKAIATVYGFLGSRDNRFTRYASFDENGVVLSSGTMTADDGTMVHLAPAVSLAQYDPVTGDGIVSTITAGENLDLVPSIWDRAGDNKAYFRFMDIEGAVPAGTIFNLTQEVSFFEATESEWLAEAQSVVPEPATLVLLSLGGLVLRRRKRNRSA